MTTKSTILLSAILAATILGACVILATSFLNIQTAIEAPTTAPATEKAEPIIITVPEGGASTEAMQTLTVTSTGLIRMPPDKSTMSVYLNIEGASAADVRDEMNKASAAFVEGIKKLGVDAADIITQSYNIQADSYYKGDNAIRGSMDISITIRNLDNVSRIIDLATQTTGYSSSYYNFDLEDKTEAYHQAIDQATAEALEKAQKIAQNMGKTVGTVIKVEEYDGYASPLRSFDKVASAAGGAVVESGSVEVRASVNVVFQMEDADETNAE